MGLQSPKRFCEIDEASAFVACFGDLELTQSEPGPLELSFQELLQVSPSQYSKSLRCHASRKLLMQKDCFGVQSVASQLGFTHFGQFSIDYARIFGESPRQTMARK